MDEKPAAPAASTAPADKRPLKMFRCMNARCAEKKGRPGFDFFGRESDPPCPKCGWTSKHPKIPVTRMTVTHFDPPVDPDNQGGLNHRACDPSISIFARFLRNGEPDPWHNGTGALSAVTCPACKETEAFKAALTAAQEE